MAPVVLHVVRPYASEGEYLEAEAWTLEARGMLLLDQAELAPDTPIVFDVALTSGEKLLRAEGRVARFAPADGDQPSGLSVRFRRFGSQTKAFLDRALKAREQQLAEIALRPSSLPPAAPEPILVAPIAPPAAPPQAEAAAHVFDASLPLPKERSGVHPRPVGKVTTPANRNELLERLRERARTSRALTPAPRKQSSDPFA